MATSLIIRDHRTPGERLKPFPLKVPAESVEQLKTWADRMKCTPSALGRDLFLRALEQLEQGRGNEQSP